MAELEPFDAEIDRSLRRSLTAPVPNLSPDFDVRLMREVDRRSRPLGRYGRALLAGYGLVSVVASMVVMHGQGLDWSIITAAILAPLALLAVPLLSRVVGQASPPGTGRA